MEIGFDLYLTLFEELFKRREGLYEIFDPPELLECLEKIIYKTRETGKECGVLAYICWSDDYKRVVGLCEDVVVG